MGAFATVAFQDQMRGTLARIGTDGALRSTPGFGTGDSGVQSIGTSWTALSAANDARRQIQIQNQSASVPVLIRFWLDSVNPGGAYRIDPGVTYSFPPGVSYRGLIQAMVASSSADVCVSEFNEPEEFEE